MIRITLFTGLNDNKPKLHHVPSMEILADTLEKYHHRKLTSKSDAGLYSAAIYNDNHRRLKENVIAHGCIGILDIDNATTFDLPDAWSEFSYIQYSTASATELNCKQRLVFELSKEIEDDGYGGKIERFTNGLYHFAKQHVDADRATTIDIARMHYLPGSFGNNDHFLYNEGKPLSVSRVMKFHRKIRPAWYAEMDETKMVQIMKRNFAQAKRVNAEKTWTTWQDCPHWNKDMMTEYLLCTGPWDNVKYKLIYYTASSMLHAGYAVTPDELYQMFMEFDSANGSYYRSLGDRVKRDCDRAWSYALLNVRK